MKLFKLLALGLMLSSTAGWAAHPFKNPQVLGKLPVLGDGREKPLSVHAQLRMKTILGRRDTNAVENYLALATGGDPPGLKHRIRNPMVQATLKLNSTDPVISELLGHRDGLVTRYHELEKNHQEKSPTGRSLLSIVNAIDTYQSIRLGQDWLLPLRHNEKLQWVPYLIIDEQIHFDSETAVLKFAREQMPAQTKVLAEYYYAKSGLHFLNFLLSIIGLTLFYLSICNSTAGIGRWAWGSWCLVLGLHLVEVALRVYISGRGPVTNMYETVMWVGLGLLIFSLVLYRWTRMIFYLPAGLIGFALCSMMNNFGSTMVSPDIHPLVPVLRNNFWLSTHVTSVTISYAAFALAWVIANAAIIIYLWKDNRAVFTDAARMAYDTNKVGLVFIVTGIILGGVWADYSWGRFWGWDPKETWSLIVTIVYSLILHGRFMGYLTPDAFIAAQAGGFLSVMMAWFGVNYILASGLHSYGFSQNGALFLAIFFGLQLVILAAFGWKARAE